MTDTEALRFYLANRHKVDIRRNRVTETWFASVVHVFGRDAWIYRKGLAVFQETAKIEKELREIEESLHIPSPPPPVVVKEDPQLRLF